MFQVTNYYINIVNEMFKVVKRMVFREKRKCLITITIKNDNNEDEDFVVFFFGLWMVSICK